MKRTLLAFLIICAGFFAFSQGSPVFDVTTYDFGEVKEGNGPISYSFSFLNEGDKPVKIITVKASCGCTTPGWTKEEVLPSDSGYVTAQYNPINRPGRFKKSLQVTYDNGTGNQTTTLYIEGTVDPEPKTIEDELPTKLGAIRLKYKSLNFGKITTEKTVTKEFDVYNDSDTTIVWQAQQLVPRHIMMKFEPVKLGSKKQGKIIVSYDPEKKDDLGFISDNIKLYTSEKEGAEKELFVIATIKEYFPPMSEEEMAKAPKLSFDKIQHDFGTVTDGTLVKTEFELTNNGKEKLLIRKTKSNCSCAEAEVEKAKIKPGQTIKMEVTFDTFGRKGRQYKTVTVFSNDPSAPSQMVTIKAEVQ